MSQELDLATSRDLSPAEMLDSAIQRGIDAEGIKTLAEVYERMEARRAEREFTVAMLAFQEECPRVLKNKAVQFTTKKGNPFNARYAALDDVARTVNPTVRKHGFTYTFDTKVENRAVSVACTVMHVGGHSKATSFTAPVDPEPALSAAHSTASATTFAQRYAFCLAFGIVPSNGDDDGRAGFTAQGLITEQQQAILRQLAEETNSLSPNFWQFVGVSSFGEIPARDFKRVEEALLQRKKRGAK